MYVVSDPKCGNLTEVLKTAFDVIVWWLEAVAFRTVNGYLGNWNSEG